MSLKSLLFSLVVLSVTSFAIADEEFVEMKLRQPNWRPKILESYANGNPQKVLFYEPIGAGIEQPVKQVIFFQNGRVQTEMDVHLISDLEAKEKGTFPLTAHGGAIQYHPNGRIGKIATFNN